MPQPKPPRMATLDSIARSVRRAKDNTGYAWGMTHNPEQCREFSSAAGKYCTDALTELELLGARIPSHESDEEIPDPNPVPLHLLNTSASRRLLALLDEVSTAAMDVDKERGWIDSDGESVGLAESIDQLAIGLRYDVYPPQGRD